MILFITPRFRHKKSGKDDCRLIALWHEDRLVIKEWDAPELTGAHIFPADKEVGDSDNKCPQAVKVYVGENGIGGDDGVGCVIVMKTAEGRWVTLAADNADFIEGKFLTFHRHPCP